MIWLSGPPPDLWALPWFEKNVSFVWIPPREWRNFGFQYFCRVDQHQLLLMSCLYNALPTKSNQRKVTYFWNAITNQTAHQWHQKKEDAIETFGWGAGNPSVYLPVNLFSFYSLQHARRYFDRVDQLVFGSHRTWRQEYTWELPFLLGLTSSHDKIPRLQLQLTSNILAQGRQEGLWRNDEGGDWWRCRGAVDRGVAIYWCCLVNNS